MASPNQNFYLSLAAVALLVLTVGYMYFCGRPFVRMPIFMWVLFGAAILIPFIKGMQQRKKRK